MWFLRNTKSDEEEYEEYVDDPSCDPDFPVPNDTPPVVTTQQQQQQQQPSAVVGTTTMGSSSIREEEFVLPQLVPSTVSTTTTTKTEPTLLPLSSPPRPPNAAVLASSLSSPQQQSQSSTTMSSFEMQFRHTCVQRNSLCVTYRQVEWQQDIPMLDSVVLWNDPNLISKLSVAWNNATTTTSATPPPPSTLQRLVAYILSPSQKSQQEVLYEQQGERVPFDEGMVCTSLVLDCLPLLKQALSTRTLWTTDGNPHHPYHISQALSQQLNNNDDLHNGPSSSSEMVQLLQVLPPEQMSLLYQVLERTGSMQRLPDRPPKMKRSLVAVAMGSTNNMPSPITSVDMALFDLQYEQQSTQLQMKEYEQRIQHCHQKALQYKRTNQIPAALHEMKHAKVLQNQCDQMHGVLWNLEQTSLVLEGAWQQSNTVQSLQHATHTLQSLRHQQQTSAEHVDDIMDEWVEEMEHVQDMERAMANLTLSENDDDEAALEAELLALMSEPTTTTVEDGVAEVVVEHDVVLPLPPDHTITAETVKEPAAALPRVAASAVSDSSSSPMNPPRSITTTLVAKTIVPNNNEIAASEAIKEIAVLVGGESTLPKKQQTADGVRIGDPVPPKQPRFLFWGRPKSAQKLA